MLQLDYNLGKDLSENKKDNQLVKHKDIELYLQLYMFNNYEEEKMRKIQEEYEEASTTI